MVKKGSRRVALLSIKPRFARAILSGEKQVELRRRPIGDSVSHVVVYATAPVKKVVGWFEVGAIREGSPHVLWEEHRHAAFVTRDEFRAYYRGARGGAAIEVRSARSLRQPQSLALLGARRPPQSFMYLDWHVFDHLRSRPTSRTPQF